MIGQAKLIALAVVGVAFLALGGFAYWQYGRANGLERDLATSESNVAVARTEVAGLNENIKQLDALRVLAQQRSDDLSKRMNDIISERDDARAALDSFRDRLRDAAIKKPTLIGRRASLATERVMRDFARATGGGAEDDGGEAVPPAASGAGAPGPAQN